MSEGYEEAIHTQTHQGDKICGDIFNIISYHYLE